jgi:phosphoribosylformimino-5-aminoimidazole carboxamide ribotide isomerase
VHHVGVDVIPVIDLRGGVAVHARRGRREEYRPLPGGEDPVAVARALSARARARTLYVADLDAIAGAAPDLATLAALSAVAGLWVDAGGRAVPGGRTVVGTESLRGDAPPGTLLSVDLRDGALISPLEHLAGRDATAAAPLARELGAAELLVIDLARVGSGEGPPLDAVGALARALPDVAIYAGGGVRGDADLRALERAGAAGALVATALHDLTL